RWSIATPGMDLREGDAIRAHESSRALLTFFDLSTATVYPLTELHLLRMRSNHFNRPFVAAPYTQLAVLESSGRALYGVAHLNPLTRASFEVLSGSAQAHLSEGSHIVKVMPDRTFEVVATRGSAVVTAAGASVVVHGGERTQVRPGGRPESPILAAEDLIQNGTFAQLDSARRPSKWETAVSSEANDVVGQIAAGVDDGQPVVHFTRTKSTYHGESHLQQVINQDVSDYNVVRLELRFKVFAQSVSGGGEQGSEYPLMVRVNYLDQAGAPQFFVRGFFIQNDRRMPITNGQQVAANDWVTLVGEKGLQLQGLIPRPQFIQSVDIQASGHDYDSEIEKVALIVE
ncbi:MAG: hypothetical protein KGJ86_14295, partial [Chloroflexota bacterium]|nr:hypothetical protein [Chloroflexota bacterium]